MRVGHQNKIQDICRDRKLLIFKQILALLHAAVDKTLFVAYLEKRAASRDLVGSAQECYFHSVLLIAPASSRRQSPRHAQGA